MAQPDPFSLFLVRQLAVLKLGFPLPPFSHKWRGRKGGKGVEGGQNEEECKNVVFPNAAVSPLLPDFPRKSQSEEKKENRLVKYVLGRGGENGVEHFRNDKGGKEQDRHFFLPSPFLLLRSEPTYTYCTYRGGGGGSVA